MASLQQSRKVISLRKLKTLALIPQELEKQTAKQSGELKATRSFSKKFKTNKSGQCTEKLEGMLSCGCNLVDKKASILSHAIDLKYTRSFANLRFKQRASQDTLAVKDRKETSYNAIKSLAT